MTSLDFLDSFGLVALFAGAAVVLRRVITRRFVILVLSKLAGSVVRQIVSGGEHFKKRVLKELEDPDVAKKVLQIFREEHQKSQEPAVQDVVKRLS